MTFRYQKVNKKLRKKQIFFCDEGKIQNLANRLKCQTLLPTALPHPSIAAALPPTSTC
jgi:hypothetical protein